MLYSEDDLRLIFWLAAAGIVLSLVAPVLLAGLIRKLFKRDRSRSLPHNYDFARAVASQPALLDSAEVAFFNALRIAVEDDFVVLAKVDLGALLRISPRARHKEALYAELAAHPADFVLLKPNTLQLVGVVALVETGKNREPFLAKAARGANLPFILFAKDDLHPPVAIAERLARELLS